MMHEWLKGKKVEDLAIIEHGGRVLFKDAVKRIRSDGSFEEIEIRVRVLRDIEKMKARKEAREIFAKQKLDPKEDADLFEQLDTMAQLARAMRSKDAPHDQFQPLEYLLSDKPGEGFDSESLIDVWRHLEIYSKMVNPAVTVVTEDDVIRSARAVSEVQNLSPLVGIAGTELDSYVITMASLLVSSLTQLQSLRSQMNSSRVA
jgi:hypothetical protein